jgi:histidinol-phosphate/aromatic aminotransferase/cobyric acid decarboxylase-like protein
VTSPDAAVWFLERPSLTGDRFADLRELRALCEDAARHDAIVIVDESNANYYPLPWSAVGLALAHENLIVARGFSKAYGLGGLRLAYCVASTALTEGVRTSLPPLLASSLSLRLGARVLGLGDITAPLRERIAAHEREAIELLERAGIAGLVRASEHLPYVLVQPSRDHVDLLEARGVVGKHQPYWSCARASIATFYRLSVPLADARMARLRVLMS